MNTYQITNDAVCCFDFPLALWIRNEVKTIDVVGKGIKDEIVIHKRCLAFWISWKYNCVVYSIFSDICSSYVFDFLRSY